MSVLPPTILLRKWWHNIKHFSELVPHHGGKTAGIDMVWRNYISATLCIAYNIQQFNGRIASARKIWKDELVGNIAHWDGTWRNNPSPAVSNHCNEHASYDVAKLWNVTQSEWQFTEWNQSLELAQLIQQLYAGPKKTLGHSKHGLH